MDQTPLLSFPLLSFHILGDQQLKPKAIELCFSAGNADAWIPLLSGSEFARLASEFPCLISGQTAELHSPALIQALTECGVKISSAPAIHRTDESVRPALPATAEWLAGDWSIAPPIKVSASNQTGSRALSLKLLQKVADDADTCEIEAIFRQDPVLAYHLLRLVNSFGVGVGRTISSFSQAILILGRQQLKRWLNLMLFAANRNDHRSAMLLARVAVRARNLELLAKAGGMDRSVQDYAFMAGMFSLLGCLFGMALPDVLKPLKLPSPLTDGLLRREGELGLLLDIVEKSERADDVGMAALLDRIAVSMEDHVRLTVEAYRWMRVVTNEQDATNA